MERQTIPTISDEEIAKDVVRRARLRYYSEQLSIKIAEMEKLKGEAIRIQGVLTELENEGE